MRNPEDNVKVVLCDLVAKGSTWDQAYAELIGVLEENAHDLDVRALDLANKLHAEGTFPYPRKRYSRPIGPWIRALLTPLLAPSLAITWRCGASGNSAYQPG